MTDPRDYLTLLDNLEELWAEENVSKGHVLPISKEGLSKLATAQLLTWDYHVWATGDLKAGIIFKSGFSPLLNKTVFQEVLWLSKNGSGVKLLKTALDFGKNQGYDVLLMGSANKMADSRLEKLYNKLGLKKDSQLWVGEL